MLGYVSGLNKDFHLYGVCVLVGKAENRTIDIIKVNFMEC